MEDERLFEDDLTPQELRELASRAVPVRVVHTREEYVAAAAEHPAGPLRVVGPTTNRGVPARRSARSTVSEMTHVAGNALTTPA